MGKRNRKNLRLVAVRKSRGGQKEPTTDDNVGNGEPFAAQPIIELPKASAADEVVTDTILFEIGGARFVIVGPSWAARPNEDINVQRNSRELKLSSRIHSF